MSDYVSNCPISGPRHTGWKASWDLGGLAWSYDWGFFYDVSSPDDEVSMRKPDRPIGSG